MAPQNHHQIWDGMGMIRGRRIWDSISRRIAIDMSHIIQPPAALSSKEQTETVPSIPKLPLRNQSPPPRPFSSSNLVLSNHTTLCHRIKFIRLKRCSYRTTPQY